MAETQDRDSSVTPETQKGPTAQGPRERDVRGLLPVPPPSHSFGQMAEGRPLRGNLADGIAEELIS